MNMYVVLLVVFLLCVVCFLLIKRSSSLTKIKEFFDNGRLRKLYYINKNSLKNSWEIFFFPNGNVNKKQYWNNGSLVGDFFIYYPNGNVYIKSQYKDNKIDGYFSVYNKNNKLLRKILYKNGIIISEETYDLEEKNMKKDIYEFLKNDYSREISEINEIYKNKKDALDKESVDYDNKKNLSKLIEKINFIKKRKKTKSICHIANKVNNKTIDICKKKQEDLNKAIKVFGSLRIKSLNTTLKSFIKILDYMEQKNKVKNYEILEQVNINTSHIKMMKNIEMSAQQFATSTATTAAAGAAALMGVPTAVTTAVTYIGTASTGTAIASLHGAAATNATLAWLGGGSIASGGGGMAAGSTILAGITAGATIFAAVAIAGIIANVHYSNKLTEATKDFAKVGENLTLVEEKFNMVNKIIVRIEEMYKITDEVNNLAKEQLDYLEPLSFDFDSKNDYYLKSFQICASLCKTLSELAQIQVLDDKGNLSLESKTKIIDIKKNIEDQNHDK